MRKHSLDEVYIETAKKLGVSSDRVKNIVNDVFGQVRLFLTEPTRYNKSAILLNKLGTIEISKRALSSQLRWMEEFGIDRGNALAWKELMYRVNEYHDTKKLKNKQQLNKITTDDERERIDTAE